ncbi:MAG: HIT family protein [Patescibacteria group bacterium]
MGCVFCNIVNKDIQTNIVYEDDVAIGVLDIHPRAPGHVVLFPKDHVHSILDLQSEQIGPFFHSVQKVVSLLQEKMTPEGFTIGINHGEVAGQEVAHLHVHVIPRWKSDGGLCIQSIVQHISKKSLDEIYKQIIS